MAAPVRKDKPSGIQVFVLVLRSPSNGKIRVPGIRSGSPTLRSATAYQQRGTVVWQPASCRWLRSWQMRNWREWKPLTKMRQRPGKCVQRRKAKHFLLAKLFAVSFCSSRPKRVPPRLPMLREICQRLNSQLRLNRANNVNGPGDTGGNVQLLHYAAQCL